MPAFKLSLIRNPAGTFSFVGTVPLQLAVLNKDGSIPDMEQGQRIVAHSNPAWISRCRVFETVDAALEAACALGINAEAVDVVGAK